MDGRQHVSPGQVLVSETGELLESHQVRRIVHVAAAEGEPGSGCRQVMESNRCVRDILAEIDRIAEVGESLRSLVLPLLGTGGDNSDLHRTVDTLLSAIVSYFEAHPASRIRAGSFLRIIGPCVSLTGAQWARIEPLLPDRTPRRTALQGGAGGGGLAVRLQIGRGSSPQWSPSRRRGHAGTSWRFRQVHVAAHAFHHPARRQTECACAPDYRLDHGRSSALRHLAGAVCCAPGAHPGSAAGHRGPHPQRISPNPAVPPVRSKDLNE